MKTKRLISVLLTFVMLLSVFPVQYAAAEDAPAPALSIESKSATPGSTVTVKVNIRNNPGVAAVTLRLEFDDLLTLTKAEAGDAFSALTFTKLVDMTPPCILSWDTDEVREEDVKDGLVLTLTFQVSEDAPLDTALPVSIACDEAVDNDMKTVDISAGTGMISVLDFMYGDVNGDFEVGAVDMTLIRRYIADGYMNNNSSGYNVNINERAADTYFNGSINGSDVTVIRRHKGGWEGYETLPYVPDVPTHDRHQPKYVPEQAATEDIEGMAAHYACDCGKLFRDAAGTEEVSREELVIPPLSHEHHLTYVAEKAPAQDAEGMKAHYKCDCGKLFKDAAGTAEISKSDLVIPSLSDLEHLTYTVRFYNDGKPYSFIDAADPTRTKVIETSVSTASTEAYILPEPYRFGYTFLGWVALDGEDGVFVKQINPGSYGEMRVTAKWTSDRNMTVSDVSQKPAVYEDTDKGEILFIYKLGEIRNVSLGRVVNFGNIFGSTLQVGNTYKTTTTESRKTASTVAAKVADTVTESTGVTLSNQWKDIVSVSEENAQTYSEEDIKTITDRVKAGGSYNISTSNGGEHITKTDKGISAGASKQKVTAKSSLTTTDKGTITESGSSHDFNIGIDGKIKNEKKIGASLGLNAGMKYKAGGEEGSIGGSAGAEASNTTTAEIGGHMGYAYNKYNKTTETDMTHTEKASSVGTSTASEVHVYKDLSTTDTSNWNTTESFQLSEEFAKDTTLQNNVSQIISETFKSESTLESGKTNTETQGKEISQNNERSHSDTVEYGFESTIEKELTLSNNGGAVEKGYYRLYEAGTVDVFAVVGYDIASGTYYTSTYSKVRETTQPFLDYSEVSTFDDEENGILPFEIPYAVHEYISSVLAKTEGIVIDDETGVVEQYRGSAENVVLPNYHKFDDGLGSTSFIKVTGFDSNTFKNNQTIKVVRLSEFITEIPDGAFEGCTSLETVIAPSVTSIGANAFSGCTSLRKFMVPDSVTALGENAFTNVNSIEVTAANASVAKAAVRSGAKIILLNATGITDTLENTELYVPNGVESFTLVSTGKTFSNVRVTSNAKETQLIGGSFLNVKEGIAALNLQSDRITLSRVEAVSDSIALLSKTDNAALTITGNVKLSSNGERAVMAKGLQVSAGTSSSSCKITVTKKMLVCGTVSTDGKVVITVNGVQNAYETISESDFDSMQTEHRLYLNANGGQVAKEYVTIRYGQAYGALPTPTRAYYSFNGWYTAAAGGVQVTETTTSNSTTDLTVYAHWSPKSYTVTWSAVPNCTIAVKRTSSPYGGAATGILSSGATVYYGDNLSVSYTPSTGYSLSTSGGSTIIVSGNITSTHIYATTKANSYTYTIKYRSSNGTDLGSSSVSGTYGSSKTVSAPAKSGYDTPAAQTVKWDATSKTITFTYKPTTVWATTKSGTISSPPNHAGLTYNATVEYQNRTANSVQLRVKWTTTIKSGSYTAYGQRFNASSGSASTGAVTVTVFNTWKSAASSDRSSTGTSNWITVPLSTTNSTSAQLSIYYYQVNSQGTDMYKYNGTSAVSATWTIALPAY